MQQSTPSFLSRPIAQWTLGEASLFCLSRVSLPRGSGCYDCPLSHGFPCQMTQAPWKWDVSRSTSKEEMESYGGLL